MLRKFIFILLLNFILGWSLVYAQREVKLKVIQTSDVHGAFFPFDYINNKVVDYGLAQVFSYVQAERAKSEQKVLFLDNGDFLQGQPTVYYANFVDSSETHLVAQLMNFMGYDAASVGNHDIEAGPNIYNKLDKQFQFPWLCANIINTYTGKTFFKPYQVFELDGIRVAVLGLTTPQIPRWVPKSLWPNMEFTDMVQTAGMWMDSIRLLENPHVVIGLFHAGHNASYEGSDPNELLNENASQLVAMGVPGFDAVLIGHDHDRLVKKVANINGDSVIILDPGSSARMVSELEITVKVANNGKVISKEIDGKLIAMRDYIPHPEFVSHFADFSSRVNYFVDRRIGIFQNEVSTRDAYFGPSAFVNIIHSVQLGISNADISFAAPLSFDAKIDQGIVYVRDMFKLYSYENLLYLMNITGEEVVKYLEYSYGLWFNTMHSENDHLLLFRIDENGMVLLQKMGRGLLESSFFNFDAAAGIIYKVDVSKPVGQRITVISMEDGTPFDLNKTYKVAINSYRGTGGGGHLTVGAGIPSDFLNSRVVSTSQMDMRHYLIKWIEHVGKVKPYIPTNWEVVPADWVKAAIPVDRELLFGSENE